MLFAYVQAVALLRDDIFDAYRFWAVGSLAGQSLQAALRAAPYIGAGLLLAAILARPLNLLALGQALAQALGLRAGLYLSLIHISSGGNIVCPLHRWTYDNQGQILGAPQFPSTPCLLYTSRCV